MEMRDRRKKNIYKKTRQITPKKFYRHERISKTERVMNKVSHRNIDEKQ